MPSSLYRWCASGVGRERLNSWNLLQRGLRSDPEIPTAIAGGIAGATFSCFKWIDSMEIESDSFGVSCRCHNRDRRLPTGCVKNETSGPK